MKQVRAEGNNYAFTYENSVFEWLQRPEDSAPALRVGHRAVLSAAFNNLSFTNISKRIERLEHEEDATAAQLLVAGFNYKVVDELYDTLDLDEVLKGLGAKPYAYVGAEVAQGGESHYGYADVFSTANQMANEAYRWVSEHKKRQAPQPNMLAGSRLAQIVDGSTLEEVARGLATGTYTKKQRGALNLLVSGFTKEVILERFDEHDVVNGAHALRASINKNRDTKARKATDKLLDFEKTAHLLANLKPNPDWGRYIACEPSKDKLFEPKRGRAGGVDPRARELCSSCMVRLYCLEDALQDDTPVVRGGLSGREREELTMIMSPDVEPTVITEEEYVA